MSFISDIAGAFGSEKAEDAQFAASQQQLAALQQGYDRAKSQYDPYAKFGAGGMSLMSRLYGLDGGAPDMSAFMESPDYQFRLGQGQKAIEGAAAARGGLFSGAAGKALTDYNQNTASQEFNDYVQRLFGMTGVGQQASTGIANAAIGAGNNMAGVHGQIGQNQANSINNQFKAWGSMGDQAVAAAMGGFGGVPGGAGAAAGGGGFSLGNAAKSLFGA